MWNASFAFRVLTWNLDKPTEMSTKGKRLRYTEVIISLRIPKGSVDMNSY